MFIYEVKEFNVDMEDLVQMSMCVKKYGTERYNGRIEMFIEERILILDERDYENGKGIAQLIRTENTMKSILNYISANLDEYAYEHMIYELSVEYQMEFIELIND